MAILLPSEIESYDTIRYDSRV